MNGQLLDILREQLQRCGPANLTLTSCPPCVCAEAVGSGSSFWPLVSLFYLLVGFLGGTLVPRREPGSTAPLLAVQEATPPREVASQIAVQTASVRTPSSLNRTGF